MVCPPMEKHKISSVPQLWVPLGALQIVAVVFRPVEKKAQHWGLVSTPGLLALYPGESHEEKKLTPEVTRPWLDLTKRRQRPREVNDLPKARTTEAGITASCDHFGSHVAVPSSAWGQYLVSATVVDSRLRHRQSRVTWILQPPLWSGGRGALWLLLPTHPRPISAAFWFDGCYLLNSSYNRPKPGHHHAFTGQHPPITKDSEIQYRTPSEIFDK